jgi:hypothetical protein
MKYEKWNVIKFVVCVFIDFRSDIVAEKYECNLTTEVDVTSM